MKLLTKSDISKAKSADRQREVDEGLKLASRVDALRETTVREEASLAKFRNETLSIINSEILSETTKRDELKQEVAVLEEKKDKALQPLTKELMEIAMGTEQLVGLKSAHDFREVSIQSKEVELQQREQDTATLEKSTTYAQDDVKKRLQNAGTLEENAERLQRLANDTLRNAQEKSLTLLATAEQHAEWVTEREKATSIKEEELRTKEIDLAKEWSRLQDREATLQRNLKRYGI